MTKIHGRVPLVCEPHHIFAPELAETLIGKHIEDWVIIDAVNEEDNDQVILLTLEKEE